MKVLLNIFSSLFIILLSCSSPSTKNESTPIKDEITTKIELSQKYYGLWISNEYLEFLHDNKSTKQAQEVDKDHLYNIFGNQIIMSMNFHEGGSENLIQLNVGQSGHIISQDSSHIYNKIQFQNGYMIVDDKKFVQATNEEGLEVLINESFISGKYTYNNNSCNR